MSQTLEQAIQEVFGTQPYYGMYTDAGNDAVDSIVRTAKFVKSSWPEVLTELRALANRSEDFSEAMDTMVRELVYDELGFNCEFYI